MVSFREMRATWLLVAALAMTGCQAVPAGAPLPAAPAEKLALPAGAIAYPFELLQAPGQTANDPLAALKLTDEQRRQLAAIPTGDQPDQSAEFRRILQAPEVDKAALKALLTPPEAALDASLKWMVAVRNILTPVQRQQLVAMSKQQPASGEETPSQSQLSEDATKRLALTPEQEQALKAMSQALEAHHRATQAKMPALMEAFMASGDTTAMRKASLENARAMPLDAVVAFYASLTQAQRNQLISQSQAEGTQAS